MYIKLPVTASLNNQKGSKTATYKGQQTIVVSEKTQLYLFQFNCQFVLLCPVEKKHKVIQIRKKQTKRDWRPRLKETNDRTATGPTTPWVIGPFPVLPT